MAHECLSNVKRHLHRVTTNNNNIKLFLCVVIASLFVYTNEIRSLIEQSSSTFGLSKQSNLTSTHSENADIIKETNQIMTSHNDQTHVKNNQLLLTKQDEQGEDILNVLNQENKSPGGISSTRELSHINYGNKLRNIITDNIDKMDKNDRSNLKPTINAMEIDDEPKEVNNEVEGDGKEEEMSDVTDADEEEEEDILRKEHQYVKSRFRRRSELLREVCAKYKTRNPTPHFSLTRRNKLYYSQRYDWLVCLNGKVSSTTWKTYLLNIRGIHPEITNENPHPLMKKLLANSMLSRREYNQRLKSSTTLLVARHPLDRLVSVYKDKFHNGTEIKPNTSVHFNRRIFWLPAEKMLKKPRTKNGNFQFTFPEVLKFILTNLRPNKFSNFHWCPVFLSCSVCQFKYDYIIKLETSQQDMEYLIDKFNVTEINLNIKENVSKYTLNNTIAANQKGEREVNSITLQYYRDVPADILSKIIDIYKLEFEIFGYDIPEEIKKKIA